MRAFLTGQHGNLPVPAGSNILGRGQDCSLRIDDPRLSRHHARLLNDGSSLIIEDLGSTNGVLVNGERIQSKKNLLSGDTVVCGPCVFTVSLDPTLKATASDFMPGTDRRPDPRQTEPMDPLTLPGSDWVNKPPGEPRPRDEKKPAANNPDNAPIGNSDSEPISSPPGRTTASDGAVSSVLKTDVFGSDVSSDALKPNEQPKVQTAPLIHRSDTTPRGNPLPAPSELAVPRSRPQKEKTTGWIPADLAPNNTPALQPDFLAGTPGGRAPAGRRLIAGVADSATAALVMLLLGLPLILGGYVWSLSQAGVVIGNGLPQLTNQPTSAGPGAGAVIGSLFHPGGVERARELATQLMHADDQQPFLTLFAASTLGVLFALVGVIIYLIGETVVRGAPFWHRRCGLEILQHRTGYHVSWGRAVARWLVFAVLWPMAPLTLALDQRALHDRITGCVVCSKRESPG